jgi:UDP-glucuronate 4-epimerase
MDFILAIEKALGIEAKKDMLPIQPGDVPATYADTTPLEKELRYKPDTSVEHGIQQFVDWYRHYYK